MEVTAMLFLGLLLLAATAAFTGLVLADNLSGGPAYDVTILGHHVATMNTLSIFCAGLALALIFGLGVMMALAGGSLRRRKSRKLAEARRTADDTARERDALAAELHKNDTGPAAGTGTGWDRGGTRDNSREGEPEYAASRYEPETAPTAEQPRHRHTRHLFGH
jgi:hypothetical protein